MKDNRNRLQPSITTVVNCFQKLLSSWWRTTVVYDLPHCLKLWIAFKNYYLRDEGQLQAKLNALTVSCELLSKIIIFVMKDNDSTQKVYLLCVVNCFQKLLSSWWRTTTTMFHNKLQGLWIAFKNYYLRDEGQLHQKNLYRCSSCELLSKIIIFVMKDNLYRWEVLRPKVVNCFQKLLSSWWRTT